MPCSDTLSARYMIDGVRDAMARDTGASDARVSASTRRAIRCCAMMRACAAADDIVIHAAADAASYAMLPLPHF